MKLLQGLGFSEAIGLVAGSMIGTGVFLKSGIMSHDLQSPYLVIAAWVVAGLLSLAGALSYAELGARYPHAGGEFAFLKQIYGDGSSFFYGWMRFWIGSPCTIAAYAIGAATFLASGLGLSDSGVFVRIVAISSIAVFSLFNCLKVEASGRLQVALTALKVFMVLGLGLAMLAFGSSSTTVSSFAHQSTEPFKFSIFAAAMIAALWAYDGWNNMPMVASEIRDPQRNVPRALVLGTLLVILLYVLVNFGYFLVLPFEEVLSANSKYNPDGLPLAAKAASFFMGTYSGRIFSFLFVISAWGAMNGSIMTSARVPYAMSVAGLFPRMFAHVTAKTCVPASSVLIQGLLSIAFSMTNSFDQLTDYVVFSAWLFYTLCTWGVIRERRRNKHAPGLYQVPFYPWTPLIFVGTSIWLMTSTVIAMPVESAIGCAIIGSGLPVYLYFRRQRG